MSDKPTTRGTENISTDPRTFVEELLAMAVSTGATDIHLSPLPGDFVVRLRVDGVLRDTHQVELDQYAKIASRLKIMADIDITERRRPQDGRFTWTHEDRPIDFRVSSIPTLHGESVVLRVLDRSQGLLETKQLGLFPEESRRLRSLVQNPSGLIVVTGPTGSGKTTTLYAALLELISSERNILTIEDPIEYEIPRVLQTAVNPKADVSFADLLRSILRHDPDVILVGEVRDAETAQVAVRAALTGHLVLTSLHTQRAAEAVGALLNLGVPPYALAAALKGVVSQQLVRKICPDCRVAFEFGAQLKDSPDFAGLVADGEEPTFSMGEGCDQCFQSGYRGRTGIFEILEVDDAIRAEILQSSGADVIHRCAVDRGMSPQRRNGFRYVLKGVTTAEEVVRVVEIE